MHSEPRVNPITEHRRSRRSTGLLGAFVVLIVVCVAGKWAAEYYSEYGRFSWIYYVMNSEWELRFLPLFLGLMVATGLAATVRLPVGNFLLGVKDAVVKRTGATVFVVALGVGIACWIGTVFVQHRFHYTEDEYAMRFQSKLFAAGMTRETIPVEWRGMVGSMSTPFIELREDHTIGSGYLPGYAAMKVPFLVLGIEDLLNPLLAACSVWLVFLVARQLWPSSPGAGILAALLLATSSQFLIMSTSYLSMPGHLCLNLLWMWLFFRNDRVGYVLAPLVGVLAMGLHQYAPHALFVAPFFVFLLVHRRFGWLAYTTVVYVAGFRLWTSSMGVPHVVGVAEQAFGVPGEAGWMTQLMNLLLTFSWQSVPFGLLVILAFGFPLRMKDRLFCLALGVVFTFGFYVFFLGDMGLGWGYRYLHPCLGNLALLGVGGWFVLRESLGPSSRLAFLAAGLLGAVVVQIPFRAFEAERISRPYADAWEFMTRSDDEIVVIEDVESLWQGWKLVRNGPYFERRARIVNGSVMRGSGAEEAERVMSRLRELGRVRIVTAEELARFGVPSTR